MPFPDYTLDELRDLQRRGNEKLAWIKRKSIKLPKSNGLGKYRRPSLSAASIYKGMETKQRRLSERPDDEPSKPLTSSAATVALSTAFFSHISVPTLPPPKALHLKAQI